jgi:hypothetical protein
LTFEWDQGDTLVLIYHDSKFVLGIEYSVTLAALDLAGNPLVSPIEWVFTTGVAEFIFPLVLR